jgi:hypothetical protein
MHGTRIERAGNKYNDVLNPYTADAPGLLIEKGQKLDFYGVQTDANTGPGVQITPPAAGASGLSAVTFHGCEFSRDGGGDQTTLTDKGAVHVKGASTTTSTDGANRIEFRGCRVTIGKADDAGSGIISPKYGVWYENTEFFVWHGTVDDAITRAYHNGSGGSSSNWRADLHDRRRGFVTLPLDAPTSIGPDAANVPIPPGAAWYDPTSSTIKVRHNDTTTKSTAALT